MKNCDEMVNSLLERRDRYTAEQEKRRKILTRTVTSACCACLAVLAGFCVYKAYVAPEQSDVPYPSGTIDEINGEPSHNNKPERTDALCPGETLEEPPTNDKIVINQIDRVSEDKFSNICLFWDDFAAMDKEELNDYYGVNIFPAVPDDIKEWEEQNLGIFRRNGGRGEVYWDGLAINYSNEDFSRSVTVDVVKGEPFCDILLEEALQKSTVNGIETALAQSDDGYYHAQFKYRGVGFSVLAKGLTQDEFVAVVQSLIK